MWVPLWVFVLSYLWLSMIIFQTVDFLRSPVLDFSIEHWASKAELHILTIGRINPLFERLWSHNHKKWEWALIPRMHRPADSFKREKLLLSGMFHVGQFSSRLKIPAVWWGSISGDAVSPENSCSLVVVSPENSCSLAGLHFGWGSLAWKFLLFGGVPRQSRLKIPAVSRGSISGEAVSPENSCSLVGFQFRWRSLAWKFLKFNEVLIRVGQSRLKVPAVWQGFISGEAVSGETASQELEAHQTAGIFRRDCLTRNGAPPNYRNYQARLPHPKWNPAKLQKFSGRLRHLNWKPTNCRNFQARLPHPKWSPAKLQEFSGETAWPEMEPHQTAGIFRRDGVTWNGTPPNCRNFQARLTHPNWNPAKLQEFSGETASPEMQPPSKLQEFSGETASPEMEARETAAIFRHDTSRPKWNSTKLQEFSGETRKLPHMEHPRQQEFLALEAVCKPRHSPDETSLGFSRDCEITSVQSMGFSFLLSKTLRFTLWIPNAQCWNQELDFSIIPESEKKDDGQNELSGIVSCDAAAIRIRIRIVRCQRPAKRRKCKLCETQAHFSSPTSPCS